MFIGLTSLSTYSFDHQRLSKKNIQKRWNQSIRRKADCGIAEFNDHAALHSNALKKSQSSVSVVVFAFVV